MGGCAPPPPAPQRVLLVTIDTLRADRLGCYGYTAASTPTLDRLARRGVRFSHAVAPTPITLPSHATILTGTYPAAHGVRNNGTFRLGDDLMTLAERFREARYRTAAFVASSMLDSRYGLDRGFELYQDDMPAKRGSHRLVGEIDAAAVSRRARSWIERQRDGRWFAWVHYFDPHFDYAPPEPFASRFADRPYDGEVANVDAALGELLRALSGGGLLENTLIAVTADHGESLGEHGERSHGIFIYESTMRVPLILAWPAGLPRGRTVEGLVRLLDLPATLLDLAGLAPLPRGQGESLAGAIAAGRAEALEALLESWLPRLNYGWSELSAVQDSRWKYIRAPRSELYDLSRDPSETENRIAQQPAVAQTYRRRLQEALRQAGRSRSGPASLPLDAETERLLRSLGYLGDYGHEPPGGARGPAGGEPEKRVLPDPKEKIGEFLPISESLLLVATGRLHEALSRLQAAERSNPSSVFIKRQIGNTCRQLGRLEQAQEKLRAAVQLNPNNPGALVDLAGVLLEQGRERARLDEAQSLLREALRQNPDLASAHHLLGLIEQARGEPLGAIAAYRAALELAPTRLTTLRNLAVLLEEQGADEEALALYLRGTELDPSDPRMQTSAAWILYRQGKLEEAARLLQRAARAAPSSPAPLLALAQVREAAAEPEAALRALRTAAGRESPPGKAHVTLARFLLQRADPCAASATLEDVASAAGSPAAAEARKLLPKARLLCARSDSGASLPRR